MSQSTRGAQGRRRASVGNVLILAALVVAAAWHFSASVFTPSPGATADSTRNLQLSEQLARKAAAQQAEVSRKQALVAAAVLASGASRAEAEDLKSTVKELTKLDPKANDFGDKKKHTPQVSLGDGSVEVSTVHEMDTIKPHWIQYIWLKDANSDEILAVKAFKPTDTSPLKWSAELPAGTAAIPMLWCNLHGLWEGEKFTTPAATATAATATETAATTA
eukprot:TRINITY_DN18334_c0_g3_i1.p1 TRINITY_DN18334_c0_g3~~TRINITY_DN18334_c0_g3_i1.p1  ORF type:complete len:220 (-),score=63.22 TRINITY_DN18334_c0_g3_i1:185-844(-)